MSKIAEIPFLKGYEVKPSSTSVLGVVTFTDGTNEIIPNQLQCEAYGYTYNKETGTCSAFHYIPTPNLTTNYENNIVRGVGNETRTGTSNSVLIGENNTVKGFSRNNIIVGNQNEIANSVNNANVFGTLGEAIADNSIVIGGNTDGDIVGERQSIQLLYGLQTTVGSTKSSYLNNRNESFFAIPENTVMYFHADTIAVRVDGTGAGSRGDYASWVVRGVIINKSGTVSLSQERDVIKSSGTVTLWRPTAAITTDGEFKINVRGATDVTIEWCSNVTFTQIKTGVAL